MFVGMSEAKVLTTKQQRKALSNAKKKKKAPVRNVYGHPCKQNWPLLSADDESIILHELRKVLCNKHDPSKPKDSIATQSAPSSSRNSAMSPQIESLRNQFVVGLRKVIVDIEKGNLDCLLLAKEVDPPSLGYLIGNLANANKVPFAVVSNLKCCLEELLGFQSWCVGFKVSSKDFDVICNKVKSAFRNLEKSRVQQKASILVEDSKQKANSCPPGKSVKNMSDLHLLRPDRNQRVFVPKSGTSSSNSDSSFLSFSKDTTGDTMYQKVVPSKLGSKFPFKHRLSSGSQKPVQSPRYFDKVPLLPLQVVRFQENPNKLKWKKCSNRSLENS